jgi:hypothetical protein
MTDPRLLNPEDKVQGELRAVIRLHLADRKREACASRTSGRRRS